MKIPTLGFSVQPHITVGKRDVFQTVYARGEFLILRASRKTFFRIASHGLHGRADGRGCGTAFDG
jgi:hypothetical protein